MVVKASIARAPLLTAATFVVGVVTSASAEPATLCAVAAREGDTKAVQEYARTLLTEARKLAPLIAEMGEDCLRTATGREFAYDAELHRFFSLVPPDKSTRIPGEVTRSEVVESLSDAELANRRAARQAELEEERAGTEAYKEAQKRDAEKERQRAIEEEQARGRVAAAELRKLRVQAVNLRVFEACHKLYQDAPDETVTNRICLDVFLEMGLPGE